MHKKKLLKTILIFLILSFMFTLCVFFVFDQRLSVMIKTASSKHARSVATFVISETVLDVLKDENVDYNDLISFEKDNAGRIVALKTNTNRINALKAEISSKIYDRLNNIDSKELSIPVGNIFNSGVFMGKGPSIKIKIAPIGAVTSDFVSEFRSAGINQTNHSIYINVNILFSVLMPLSSVNESIETSICACETLIIGEVPGAFTNVQNIGEPNGFDLSGDIVDFGAHDINENDYRKSDG